MRDELNKNDNCYYGGSDHFLFELKTKKADGSYVELGNKGAIAFTPVAQFN
ncbi:hypothetical protein [uncultured Nostoc sp.]|uniref:hypothetical protein n=1 Tax=uncultured Nostoc sp. TaxID=340711 RepID=UPI0035CBEB63